MGVRVLRPGLLTTVQDEGRWGYQMMGVSVAGPMDRVSHRLANLVVGNPPEAATLEVTLVGPELEFEADHLVAVSGAEFDLGADGRSLTRDEPHWLRRGARLVFGPRRRGARAYLAVAGGFAVEPVLGSRATHLPSRMGGLGGRPLRAGDRLPVGAAAAAPRRISRSPLRLPEGGARLRALWGPQEDLFTDAARAAFTQGRYTVTPESNRMGYRLAGPPLERRGPAEILSEATPPGSIQVPPAGQPILFMVDCPTTGGYPKIATVISADLPLAGQLAPGDWIEFEIVDRVAALAALAAEEDALRT